MRSTRSVIQRFAVCAVLAIVPQAGAAVPSLTSPTASSITTNDALLGATIVTNGGDVLTARGTLWGTTTNPTGNMLAEGGTGDGVYTHTRTNLGLAQHIYFKGYAINASGTGYSSIAQFYTEPRSASNATFSSITSNGMMLSWQNGNGSGRLAVMRQGSAVTATPADGTLYSASSIFGSGSDLGTSEYVVHAGNGNYVRVSNLVPDTVYHAVVYEYSGGGTGGSGINYRVTGATTVSNTTASSNPPTHNLAYLIDCDSCHASVHGSSTYVPRNEDQQAVCKTCHNPTGQASSTANVTNHISPTHGLTIDCGSCHEVHNSTVPMISMDIHSGSPVVATNQFYLRSDMTKYWPQALTNTVFHDTNIFAFAETNAPWNGVCQSCHTNTIHHTNLAGSDHDHEMTNSLTCVGCHLHGSGF